LSAGQAKCALVKHAFKAARYRLDGVMRDGGVDRVIDVSGTDASVRVELVAQRSGEETRVLVTDQDRRADVVEGHLGERYVAEKHPLLAVRIDVSTEPVGQRARLRRFGGRDDDELAGLHGE